MLRRFFSFARFLKAILIKKFLGELRKQAEAILEPSFIKNNSIGFIDIGCSKGDGMLFYEKSLGLKGLGVDIDEEKKRVNCSLKQTKENPWIKLKEDFSINDSFLVLYFVN